MTGKLTCAAVLGFGFLILNHMTVIAEPMKCSGEQQACLTTCTRLADQKLLRPCINACGARQAACRQTGCWDNGSRPYCGLLRQ